MSESQENEPRVGEHVRVWLGNDMYRQGVIVEVDAQDKMVRVKSEYGRTHYDYVRWDNIC